MTSPLRRAVKPWSNVELLLARVKCGCEVDQNRRMGLPAGTAAEWKIACDNELVVRRAAANKRLYAKSKGTAK